MLATVVLTSQYVLNDNNIACRLEKVLSTVDKKHGATTRWQATDKQFLEITDQEKSMNNWVIV